MEVALDLTPTLSGQTGVSRYASELARALPGVGVTVRGFSVGRGAGSPPPGTRHIHLPRRALYPVWRSLGIPRAEWLAGGGDVVHSVDLELPPTQKPLVASICDVAALQRPDLHPPTHRIHIRRRVEELDRAAVVLVISHATASALIEHGIEEKRIVVSPLAPSGFGDLAAAPMRQPGFVLSVGEITARKDYPTLVRAMARNELRNLRLVMAGPVGYRGEEVIDLVRRLGLMDRIEILGRVTESDLGRLYRDATVLCSTSVIEGFGLPLVEAMASGLPIVSSDIEVAREVADDAALYAPVGDEGAFAAALHRVSSDEALRADLRVRGLHRSRAFAWTRTADLTAGAYRKALECGSP